MDIAKVRVLKREGKKASIRKKTLGTAERPRLCVRRTLRNMIAQVVDDLTGKSILQLNSNVLEVKGKKTAVANALGKELASKLKEKGIEKVVFDRSGYVYHGRIKAVADGAREGGLKF